MAKLKLSAPWIIFYREIEAMFQGDPEVRVVFDEDNLTVKLYVDDGESPLRLTLSCRLPKSLVGLR